MFTLLRPNASLPPPALILWIRRLPFTIALTLLLAGCATPRSAQRASDRPFRFQEDTFAYANQLLWEYHLDPTTGQMQHTRRASPPSYAQHCFVVARAARQFFLHARFDPSQPQPDAPTCKHLIRQVISGSPSKASAAEKKVVIPGYANLYAFSQANEVLLKAECGGAWHSYVQRGHWRMIFPLPPSHQERMAQQLLDSLGQKRPPIVHLVRFPSLSINHAVLLYAADEDPTSITFTVYDPNSPDHPARLIYRRAQRRFEYPPNTSFAGGRVDVYEVYRSLLY